MTAAASPTAEVTSRRRSGPSGCRPGRRPGAAGPPPDDRRDQPLRGHVQVAVGLRDHARGEAAERRRRARRRAGGPAASGRSSRYQATAVPARFRATSSAKVTGAPNSSGDRGEEHAEHDDRGVGHQVDPVGRVEPVGEQAEVAEQGARVDGQEPLVERLVVGVERERPGGRVGPQPVGEPAGEQPEEQAAASRSARWRRAGRPAAGRRRDRAVRPCSVRGGPPGSGSAPGAGAGCAGHGLDHSGATSTGYAGSGRNRLRWHCTAACRRAGVTRPGGGTADTAALKAAAARRAGSTPAPGTRLSAFPQLRDPRGLWPAVYP